MRLGQLSRKLELPTAKIIAFIEKEFEVTISDHPNTKIEDSFLDKIEAKFIKDEPKPVEKVASPKEIKSEVVKPEPILEVEETKKIEPEVIEELTTSDHSIHDLIGKAQKIEDEEDKEIELIKAPKPELKQIKVLRKIDLPQKKKTITVEDNEEESIPKTTAKDVDQIEKELKASIEKPAPIKRKESTYVRPNKPMKKKKSVDEILAEKKARQEKERIIEEKKKKEKEAYDKKRKKEHYAAQLAKKQPKKKKKKKIEEVEQVVNNSVNKKGEKEQPKSWIGKLIRWFQTS